MKKIALSIIIPVLFTLFSIAAYGDVITLQPLTTFGSHGDGSVRPGDLTPDLSATGQLQRGMAYNATTGHLLVVDRSTNGGINYAVNIIDGNTGTHLGALDTSSGDILSTGGNTAFIFNLVGVAEDGSIYAGNLSSATSSTTIPQYRLYRWASETSSLTRVLPTASSPNDDPSNGNTNSSQKRWGDTMAVRGSGMTTQILIANRGTLVALLTPTDSSLTAFSIRTLTTDAPVGGFSIGLSFGAGDTFWSTSGAFNNGPLLHLQFDALAGTATTLTNFPSPTFPGTISPILVVPSSNLLAGITMVSGADSVRLYDISNSNSPVLLDRKSFVTANNNNAFSGSLALGTNGVLYALDSDNGIMAFTFASVASNSLSPAFFLNPANQLVVVGASPILTSGADSTLPISYQWLFAGTPVTNATNISLTLTNVQTNNAGGYSIIASNSLGSVTSSVATLTVVATPPNSLLNYDPIPYAAGSFIAGQGNWSSPPNQGITFVSEVGNLDVPGLAASQSNRITWPLIPAASIRLTNATTLSGSIYFSFAYRIDNLGSLNAGVAGVTIAAFVENFTTASYTTKINVHTNATGVPGYNLGVFKGGAESNGGYATNVLSLSNTVFVVGRYTYSDGTTDDTCALWLDPNPSTFGATNAPSPTVGDIGVGATDFPPIVGFALRSSNGPSKSYADEIRVGLAWSDVTPPAAVALPRLTVALSNNAAVLSWPTSATGFNLEGTGSLNSPISWSPVTNSVVINGTNNTVSVGASSGNQFFRLRK